MNSGKLDAAFLRPEANAPHLVYRVVTQEPLIVVLARDHRLSSRDVIDPKEIAGEKFVSVSRTARSDRRSRAVSGALWVSRGHRDHADKRTERADLSLALRCAA